MHFDLKFERTTPVESFSDYARFGSVVGEGDRALRAALRQIACS